MSKPRFYCVLRHEVTCNMVFADTWVITGGALVFYRQGVKVHAFGPTYWHTVRKAFECELRDRLDSLKSMRNPEPQIVEQIEWLNNELFGTEEK